MGHGKSVSEFGGKDSQASNCSLPGSGMNGKAKDDGVGRKQKKNEN